MTQDFVSAIEPSSKLLPSINEDAEEKAVMLKNFGAKNLESDWSFEDDCHFSALPGRLFNESIAKMLEKRYLTTDLKSFEVSVRSFYCCSTENIGKLHRYLEEVFTK